MRTIGIFNKVKKITQKMFQGYYSQILQIPPSLNTQDYLVSYGQIGWLFACTSRIANDVGDTEWKAYRQGEEEPIKNSKALDLLNNPNPYFSKFKTLELTQMYLDLVGKCFWYIAKDRAGRPAQIWVISPLNMTVIPDRDNFIQGFVYQAGAQRVPLSTDEVIMFNYQDPNNPYDGVSPAKAAAVSLESDKFAAQWNRNFFYNNAEPQGIVSFPDGVEENDFKAWIEKWQDKYGGVGNAKKTAFIRGGQVSYTAIQISQKDMDFYNLRLNNRDEILAIFGVPKSVLGIVEDVNRASAETSEYTYMKHTVSPKLKRIQDIINNEFVEIFGEQGIELRFTDVVPENKDFIKAVIDTQTDKSITKNEARNILNKLLGLKLEPIEGGDVIYQAISLQPLGTKMPTVQPTPPKDDNKPNIEAPKENDNNSDNNNSDDSSQKNLKKKVDKSFFQNLDKEAYWKSFVQKTDKFEKDMKLVWEGIFDHQRDKIITNIKAHKSIKGLSMDDILRFLLDNEDMDYIKEQILPLLKKIMQDKGDQVFDELNVDTSFDLHDPKVTEWLEKYCGDQITNINSTTQDLIKKQLTEGQGLGESIPNLCNRIKDYCDGMKDSRIESIARTEVIGASNNATLMSYQQSGVVAKKQWLTAIDGREREWHAEADGQNVNVDESFIVDGEELDCPGGMGGSAENVINCRCTMIPIVD